MSRILAIKIDVDTDHGTATGVPALADILKKAGVPATFLFSLGPDNTGRAIVRLLRPGFLAKCLRSGVVSNYGFRTLGNGVLWPGPMIAQRHAAIMRQVREQGFEVGVHTWDHIFWQDHVQTLPAERVLAEVARAAATFEEVFGHAPQGAGAAGWQACKASLQAYDKLGFRYASDCRGSRPFRPRVDGYVARTPQIPTTLPTLDEVLGRDNMNLEGFTRLLLDSMQDGLNVLTIHAELEGGAYGDWFAGFLESCKAARIGFTSLEAVAASLPEDLSVCDMILDTVPGRSGTLSMQKMDIAA